LFGLPPLPALFIGIALTATSVGISAQTLMELGALRRRESLTLLGAAVVDDLAVLLVLSIFLALTGGAGAGLGGVVLVLGRLLLFLVLVTALGFVIPRLAGWAERLPLSHGLTSFVLVTVLLIGWSAEALGGVAAITGAFLAGLAFARSPLKSEIEHDLAPFAYGFLIPLFFVSIGLAANLRAVTWASLLFSAVLLVVVAGSKILGGGLGARWGGLTGAESFRLGLGMISRGEVVLIVASVGLAEGLLSAANFSEIVLVALATMVLTPLLLRRAYGPDGGSKQAKG
jgi:Kef-type K+ transport system membrane component KefB